MEDEDDRDGERGRVPGGARRGPTAALAVGVVTAFLLLVAVVTSARNAPGPLPSQDPPVVSATAAPLAAPTVTLATASRQPLTNAAAATVPRWLVISLLVTGGLIAAVAVALAVRALLRLLRRVLDDRRARATGEPGPGVDPLVEIGEKLRERVTAAADALEEDSGPPGDAVVACWLDLERAAAATGSPRAPSQTASEFTAALLRRHTAAGADRELRVLLGLYQRARFSAAPVTAADIDVARRCLRTIAGAIPRPAAVPAADQPTADQPTGDQPTGRGTVLTGGHPR